MAGNPNFANRDINARALALLKSDDGSAYGQLRPTEKQFVDHFIACDNPTEAYLRVHPSYRENVTAVYPRVYELCKKPLIKAAIYERMREIAARVEVTAERVIKEVAALAFANQKAYTVVNADGEPVLGDWSRLSDDQWAAISEITTEIYIDGSGDNAREVKRVRYKLHDKGAALDKLMKNLGLYEADNTKRVEHTGTVNQNVRQISVNMTIDQAADYYAQSLRGDEE